MPETQELRATEAHYGLLVDIEQGKVYDLMQAPGETPHLDVDGDAGPVRVAQAVWDMETLGWCWRPADDTRWQLTDTGRAALEGSGL